MKMLFANKDISYKRAVHPLPVEKGVLSAKIEIANKIIISQKRNPVPFLEENTIHLRPVEGNVL